MTALATNPCWLLICCPAKGIETDGAHLGTQKLIYEDGEGADNNKKESLSTTKKGQVLDDS